MVAMILLTFHEIFYPKKSMKYLNHSTIKSTPPALPPNPSTTIISYPFAIKTIHFNIVYF